MSHIKELINPTSGGVGGGGGSGDEDGGGGGSICMNNELSFISMSLSQ